MLLSSNVVLVGGNSTKRGSSYYALIKAVLSLWDKSKKKAAKKKLASCSDSLTQLLVLALDFELPKTKEESPLSAPAASPACSPFLSLSLSSSVSSPSLPPVLQVHP